MSVSAKRDGYKDFLEVMGDRKWAHSEPNKCRQALDEVQKLCPPEGSSVRSYAEKRKELIEAMVSNISTTMMCPR